MARLSARSRWFARLTLVSISACVQASAAPAIGDPQLTDEEIRDPAVVREWLKTHSRDYQRHKHTQHTFKYAEKAENSKNWSAAAKAYGESMIRYPAPETLAAHARVLLLMLGQVRARNGDTAAKAKGDVAYSLSYFESALAANEVVATLGPDEASAVHGRHPGGVRLRTDEILSVARQASRREG